MKITDYKIEYKPVARAKVTISSTRFDIKIPVGSSKQDEEKWIQEAQNLFDKNWSKDMITFRCQLSRDV